MRNPNPEKGGYFFKQISSNFGGVSEQWSCAACGSPAIGATFGALKCTNSPEDCVQGQKLYAFPTYYLEPYDPAKHGR